MVQDVLACYSRLSRTGVLAVLFAVSWNEQGTGIKDFLQDGGMSCRNYC
jgi:hypothetical protein